MNESCQSVRRTSTSHAQPCHRPEGHDGPCSFADGNGMHVWLDGYEIANLREALRAATDHDSPLRALDNGDWIHQVRRKIEGFVLPNNPPNETASQLVGKAVRRA